MDEVVTIELSAAPATAPALADPRREAVAQLVDRLVQPASGEDPLRALLEATRQAALLMPSLR
jgi:hypothetical protein